MLGLVKGEGWWRGWQWRQTGGDVGDRKGVFSFTLFFLEKQI